MKTFRIILCAVVSVALFLSIALSCFASTMQKTGGSYSTTTTITEESRRWILDHFDHCRSIDELLAEIDRFGCENFVYQRYQMPLIQAFCLDKFLFEDNLHGVCFEFSCFVKCVVLVWKESHQRNDVQAFVYDVILPNGGRHSYNFIMAENRTWYFCLTTDVSRVASGRKAPGPEEITGMTPQAYMKKYGDTLTNIH